MEANLVLRTQHLPAMRHHKTVVVHSSVRLPALQAKVGPPPGSARVAVVGAGVVLACALGAMYWKRAKALPLHRSSPTGHVGKNGDSPSASGDVSIGELTDLLSETCIRSSDPKPPRLTELLDQCLTEKDKEIVRKGQTLTSVLKKKYRDFTITELTLHDYNFGLVLTLALINEKEYAKAKDICSKLQCSASPTDSRPNLLLAIINMMMATESMLRYSSTTSTSDLQMMLKLVEEAWEEFKSKPGFAGAPPF